MSDNLTHDSKLRAAAEELQLQAHAMTTVKTLSILRRHFPPQDVGGYNERCDPPSDNPDGAGTDTASDRPCLPYQAIVCGSGGCERRDDPDGGGERAARTAAAGQDGEATASGGTDASRSSSPPADRALKRMLTLVDHLEHCLRGSADYGIRAGELRDRIRALAAERDQWQKYHQQAYEWGQHHCERAEAAEKERDD